MKLSLYLYLVLLTLCTFGSFVQANEIRMLSDIAYGNSDKQVLDVYYPSIKRENAPVIFMVHGGGWRVGDKASESVVKNKVAHWVSKGFVFVSINYRMLPELRPLEQAKDVERALIFSQKKAHEWGGSDEKFILMGHSAGAHLISLISVYENTRIKPWLGTVALDSAAYDVSEIMKAKSPPRLYKRAFGKEQIYWEKASPINILAAKLPPFLAVCSSKGKNDSCSQAKRFIEKAKRYGTQAQLLPLFFSHRAINAGLGEDYCYTREVDKFIKKLHPDVGRILTSQSISHLRYQANPFGTQRCDKHSYLDKTKE